MKRLIGLLLALLMVLTLGACSSSDSTDETTVDNGSSEESTTLRVGMECNYAPFNWTTTEEGEHTKRISSVDYCDGYDVQVASYLGEQIGKEVEVVKLDWDNLILSLNNNEIDLIIAGMTATEERKEEINFTDPYYVSEEVMIVRKDGTYTEATSLEDFEGATIQGQMSTIYDEIIDQIPNVNHMPAASDFPAAIQALQGGSIDGVTSELPVANGVVSANSDLVIVRFESGKGFEADTSVSIGVRKSDAELLASLNDALATIDSDTRNSWMEDAVNRQPANEE